MDSTTSTPERSEATNRRIHQLFEESQEKLHKRTDRMFAALMALQWLAGIIAALWISPKAWVGQTSYVHLHVWAALLLGGAISGFPIFLALTQPGKILTRHVIAVGQMLTSALLIHLTGGRIETHFHVFGSLAFLAFYRDWRVMLSATVVVAAAVPDGAGDGGSHARMSGMTSGSFVAAGSFGDGAGSTSAGSCFGRIAKNAMTSTGTMPSRSKRRSNARFFADFAGSFSMAARSSSAV